jgi:hypothetical protein
MCYVKPFCKEMPQANDATTKLGEKENIKGKQFWR